MNRGNFHIEMPDGRVVPLAIAGAVSSPTPRKITKLRQNARIFDHDVKPYFPTSADTDALRLFALPGEGTVRIPLSFLLEDGPS